MKLLFIILCCPLLTVAQLTGRYDDSLRKVSDTMHFPEPFMFKMSANTTLPPSVILKKTSEWMAFVKDSLKAIIIVNDSVHNKIAASNVPATADISYSILITVSEGTYVCTLQDYIFHTINNKLLPVEKAAMVKDYKQTTNIERVVIMRNHQQIFKSLNKYIEKAN